MSTTNLQANRYNLRKSLWNSRAHQASSPEGNSFDRVLALSPSLADCLDQRTTQVRNVRLGERKFVRPLVTEALEKLTFEWAHLDTKVEAYWRAFTKAAQPYLRSTEIEMFFVHHFVNERCSQPRLRSIVIHDGDFGDKLYKSMVFLKFGGQLKSFTYEGTLPFDLISTVNSMPPLKKLKMKLFEDELPGIEQPSIERIIPWSQLSDFSLQCYYSLLDWAQLFKALSQMTQLRKLSIRLQPDSPDQEDLAAQENQQFLIEKFREIPIFSKLEVLSFGVYEFKHPTLNYRFLLGLLVPKLGPSLTKLIYRFPHTFSSTSYTIFLDYTREFPHLRSLVLDYKSNQDRKWNTYPKLYHNRRKVRPTLFLSLRHLTITNFNSENLAFNKILKQIPTIFPNLVELNFNILPWSSHCPLADGDLMAMISRLPQLATLRFMDSDPKFLNLLGSIELMCKRAFELKPKVPMLFRVPLGLYDFERTQARIKFTTDQLPDELKHHFQLWDKAAKWIQLF